MKETKYLLDFNEEEESFQLKELLIKYLRHWPWFLGAIIFCLGLGYLYMRYAPITYKSVAKIKIIDQSMELNVASNGSAMLGKNTNINLDNEIEVLKSYRLLSQVGTDLNLEIDTYEVGTIKTTQIWDSPFTITELREEELSVFPRTYMVTLSPSKITINDEQGRRFNVSPDATDTPTEGLPFNIVLIENTELKDYQNIEFKVVINLFKDTMMNLAKNLEIEINHKKGNILSLTLEGQSPDRSEAILNTIIAKFNQDGILDRQLVSRRTLEVIDKRFIYLSGELDSIEVGKQDFKESNALSYIEADAGISLQQKSEAEAELVKFENQLTLAQLLKMTVANEAAYSLLPGEIGLDNMTLNSLVFNYNEMALERNKLITTVGQNHPLLRRLSAQMEEAKLNILNTVNVYQSQLRISLQQLNRQKSRAGFRYSKLPEKEKLLRGIERQQTIKENLFLLLLEKREEAAIKMAATAPSIKVVDYALTQSKPVAPKKIMIYPLSLVVGMLLPFLVLYIRFSLDTKIRKREDLEELNPEIPVLSEIPFIKGSKKIQGFQDRSPLAESFRMLSASINYSLPEKNKNVGQVIYVTSAIKGEGKSLVAYNLAFSYASLKKRILLVGADLRNPQLHVYLDIPKNTKGVAEYLSDPSMDWWSVINEGISNDLNIQVCYSRKQPPNVAALLSGEGFEKLINAAKKEFDYIIVDTAPTLPVSDTFIISQHADITVFVARADYTEKRLVKFSMNLAKTKKLRNMAYVFNGVGKGKTNYNYGYGYGDKSQ